MELSDNPREPSTAEQPAKHARVSIGRAPALTILTAILAGAFLLQVYEIDEVDTSPDNCRLVENAVLALEGYQPFFLDGYAMTPIWVWSGIFHGEWLIKNYPLVVKGIESNRFKDIFVSFSDHRRRAFAHPLKVQRKLIPANALAAVLVAFFAYLIGSRWSGSREAGLIAAILCGISPILVKAGTDFHPDQYQAAAAAGCVFFCIGEACGAGKRQWPAAAILAGVAMGAKFIAVTFWIPLLAAIIMGPGEKSISGTLKRIVAATAVVLAAYMIINPYFLGDISLFSKGIAKRFFLFFLGNFSPESNDNSFMQIAGLFRNKIGPAALALCVIGLIWGVLNKTRGAVVIIVAVGGYLLLLGSSGHIQNRYTLSLLPLICAAAGAGAVWVAEKAPRRFYIPALFVLIVLAALPVENSLKAVNARLHGDTRKMARNWIEENVPAGSRIFTGYHAPVMNYDEASARLWKHYFGYKITSGSENAFPVEYFRDAILHEEKFMYKRFCYLADADNLPSPGYDLVEMTYAPDDPTLLKGVDTCWLVVSKVFFKKPRKQRLAGELKKIALRKGKREASFPGKGKYGHGILIYKIDLRTPR